MNKWLLFLLILVPGYEAKAQKILLNEIAAAVSNSQVDNYGEFEDWIEIFNSTNTDIDLAGWYLSDSPSKPLKWRIPAGNPKVTTVMAGSYLLLWADKDTVQGPDHLNFSLKRKGEYLSIYKPGANGPVLVDSVHYGKLASDQSYGRCPGQRNEWRVFKHPTPGKANICPGDKKASAKKIPLPAPDPQTQDEYPIVKLSGNNGLIISINEISCNNKYSLLDEFGENDDWIELYNPGPADINIAGWYISDTLNTAIFHRIPSYDLPKTLVPAGGYLILWADGQSFQGAAHLPFKLDKDGENVYLAKLISGQYEIMDQVTFPKAKNDVTYGRIPNGTGSWKRLSDPTPHAANIPPRILGGFLVNELMAVSGPNLKDEYGEEEDWIEFYNPTSAVINIGGLYLTDSLADTIKSHISVYSPDSTSIAPGGYLVFYADNETGQGVRHLNFKLPAKGGNLYFFQSDGSTLISMIKYRYQAGDASFGRFPDGRDRWVFLTPTPGVANKIDPVSVNGLVINELMADNKSYFPDNLGHVDDWIELYNENSFAVNTGGLYMTDSLADPLKFRVPNTYPDSTTIPAKGFLVFWADNHPERGVRHLDFKLAAAGESAGLTEVNDTGEYLLLDGIIFPAQSADVSYGRMRDGASVWTFFTSPTPDATNGSQSSGELPLESGSISIYPNPFYNILNISILLTNVSYVTVEIFSEDGALLSRSDYPKCPVGRNGLQISDASERLIPGFYMVRVTAGTEVSYRKVMKIG